MAAREGGFTSKTRDLQIVVESLGALVLMLDRLACWIDDLGYLTIVGKKVLDPVLVYVTLRRGQGSIDRLLTSKTLFLFSIGVQGRILTWKAI